MVWIGSCMESLASARDQGRIGRDVNIDALTFLITGAAHSIGVRARAGQPRAVLELQVEENRSHAFPVQPYEAS